MLKSEIFPAESAEALPPASWHHLEKVKFLGSTVEREISAPPFAFCFSLVRFLARAWEEILPRMSRARNSSAFSAFNERGAEKRATILVFIMAHNFHSARHNV
jgi:hypothetical protein